jgi:pimeloyl-ACP methyl ester carboxylesterase
MSETARLRRTYFDCRYGQLHVHQAIPPGGGFDEATALLCLPGAPGLGSFFVPLLPALGNDRSIYAPDLPGSGGSDPVPGRGGAAQFAQAMADLLASLRQRRVDLLVHADGAETALALVALQPTLVRQVAWSAPPAQAVRAAGALQLTIREFPLAGALDQLADAAAVATQLPGLIRFLGSGKAT